MLVNIFYEKYRTIMSQYGMLSDFKQERKHSVDYDGLDMAEEALRKSHHS